MFKQTLYNYKAANLSGNSKLHSHNDCFPAYSMNFSVCSEILIDTAATSFVSLKCLPYVQLPSSLGWSSALATGKYTSAGVRTFSWLSKSDSWPTYPGHSRFYGFLG
jgi:hypothetical protein